MGTWASLEWARVLKDCFFWIDLIKAHLGMTSIDKFLISQIFRLHIFFLLCTKKKKKKGYDCFFLN